MSLHQWGRNSKDATKGLEEKERQQQKEHKGSGTYRVDMIPRTLEKNGRQ
jgi:hypothetical protein